MPVLQTRMLVQWGMITITIALGLIRELILIENVGLMNIDGNSQQHDHKLDTEWFQLVSSNNYNLAMMVNP